MFYKKLCILVFWTKVASALEGLKSCSEKFLLPITKPFLLLFLPILFLLNHLIKRSVVFQGHSGYTFGEYLIWGINNGGQVVVANLGGLAMLVGFLIEGSTVEEKMPGPQVIEIMEQNVSLKKRKKRNWLLHYFFGQKCVFYACFTLIGSWVGRKNFRVGIFFE